MRHRVRRAVGVRGWDLGRHNELIAVLVGGEFLLVVVGTMEWAYLKLPGRDAL